MTAVLWSLLRLRRTRKGRYCFACRNTRKADLSPAVGRSWLCTDEAACLGRAGSLRRFT